MSVYRQAGRGRPALLAAVAVAALLAGVGLGAALFGGDDSEPSLRDAIGRLRGDLRPATESLDALPIEYEQGVRGGRVVAPTEYDGARGHLEQATKTVRAAHDDLALLSPADAAAVDKSLATLTSLVSRHADAAQVEAAARAAAEAIRKAGRLTQG
jgi:hypothetical protein